MRTSRHLEWDGLFNARDLGGLAATGGETRWGAVVRSESPEGLTAAGWEALHAYGIRTIIDLRNDDELGEDLAPRPAGVVTVRRPLEDYTGEAEFWRHWLDTGLDGTPLYYQAFLDAYPHAVAAAVIAIATAGPGGVLVHCAAGKDRTGLVSLMLLALAGVAPTDIIADHTASGDRFRRLWALRGLTPRVPTEADLIAAHGTTATESLAATLAGLDAEAYLRKAGMSADDITAARTRSVRFTA